MTGIIYSLVSLLMLTMEVATFDHWGNTVRIPEDNSVEMQEMSLFPARHIRPDSSCTCKEHTEPLDYGTESYPRYLVSNKCLNTDCVKNKWCREINFTFNVSRFEVGGYGYDENNARAMPIRCLTLMRSTSETISVACVPAVRARRLY